MATELDVVLLDLQAHRARAMGRFDAAVGLDSLAEALHKGQLTRAELHTDAKRVRLFGGQAVGV